MKRIILLLSALINIAGYSQFPVYGDLDVYGDGLFRNDIEITGHIKIGDYYIVQDADSIWVENPLETWFCSFSTLKNSLDTLALNVYTAIGSGGVVNISGTPVAGQIAIFTGAKTIGGNSGFLFTGSTRTVGAYYTGTDPPNNDDVRSNLNAHFYATRITAAGLLSNKNTISTTGSGTTGVGLYANTIGAICAKLAITGSGSGSIGVPLLITTSDYNLQDNTTGTALMSITDNPVLNGYSYQNKILSATIGTTERISLNPRATSTTFGYMFDTHSTIDSIFNIKNNGVSQFKITSEGVNLPTKPQTGTFNLVLKNGVVDTLPLIYEGNLTDGAPTDAEIDAATGLTPITVGAGFQVTIKDTDGTGLLYKIESDGTDWYYTPMTKAL